MTHRCKMYSKTGIYSLSVSIKIAFSKIILIILKQKPISIISLWVQTILQRSQRLQSKLCENIGIFIKDYKSTNPGSNKVVYGPCEQESEEKKFKILIFQYAKSYFCKNKLLVIFFKIFLLRFYVSRHDEQISELKSKLETFEY